MANRAIRYRVYPTTEQAVMFAKTFGCCRKVYNLMLADKITAYKETGKFPMVTPARYKQDYPYLKEVDSLALANKQLDLQRAFSNCFSKTRKKCNGFPKFKSAKHSRKSYTTNNQNGTVFVCDNAIRLPKIGLVKAVIHRKPNNDWKVKSATVSQESDGKFYISVLYEFTETIPDVALKSDNAIGLDYSSSGLYVDSEGNHAPHHKYYKESHDKLAKAQRILSRRKGFLKGEEKSKNYLRQLNKVNRIHRRVANQRLDHLHKLSTEIANQYDIVCVESLDMKSIANKKFGNGKATMDNGYGLFLSLLEYKLRERGKILIRVDKWYPSSQLCSCCGHQNHALKNLSVRSWVCPDCSASHDRDINAAINIRKEGLRLYFA